MQQQAIVDVHELLPARRQLAAHQLLDHPFDPGIGVANRPGVVAAAFVVIHHFFRRQSECNEIFRPDLVADFDVRAVVRADRDGPVHHEFHVAGS